MIKAISPYVKEAVMYHVDESQLKGEFPKPWKMNIVHPLPKTQSNVFNLRSISVLPATFMILEKLAIRQIVIIR